METFYTPRRCVTPPVLVVTGDELVHLANVMRLGPGDALRVVDGEGNCYGARITALTRTAASCAITSHEFRPCEPERQVTLGVGLLKNPARFEFLVEKSVELGVHAIVPLITARTVARQAKAGRLSKIAIAAMKQSGRSVLPGISPPVSFQEFVEQASPLAARLLPHEQAPVDHPLVPPHGMNAIIVAIGPEGGFSEEEVGFAAGKGFAVVSLGARRLRTETAAIVAVAAVLRGA
jgi:16S rRNA (uracil1498-N3)-methyltransferase